VIERIPGKGQYAKTEREHRWLLNNIPECVTDPVDITDLYFDRSTLRLRRARDESTVVYKLGQKVRHDPRRPSLIQMTNMYLSELEYNLMRQVSGNELTKTRWRWTANATDFSVDQFDGSLRGLVLAEIELDLEEPVPEPPSLAVADVTEDDRFSGGHLAGMTSLEANELMTWVAQLTEPSA
jgi:CYTH domain-containing protein